MKIYPAYGRTIARLVQRGLEPIALGVLFSSRWWYLEDLPRVCLRPDEWERGKWEFSFLRNQHVVAIWGEDAELLQLVELLLDLMLAGPRLIWVCDHAGQWHFKEEDPDQLIEFCFANAKGSKIDWRLERATCRREYRAAQHRVGTRELKIAERLEKEGRDLIGRYNEQQAQLAAVSRLFANLPPVAHDAHAG